MPPKLNRQRALFVLGKIDEILAWKQRKEKRARHQVRGTRPLRVRGSGGQYWRIGKLKSFDEFLERKFPESRRKAYYLMSIHEHLPLQARRQLKGIGWTKALELTEVARKDGQRFNLCNLVAQGQGQFRREVARELTGEGMEPWEIVYFKSTRARFR